MPFNVINSRHPGTLCQSEVIYQDGVTHAHLVKRVSAQRRHFDAGFRRVNGIGRVQHGNSPAVSCMKYRHLAHFLESGRHIRRTNSAIFNMVVRAQPLPALHLLLLNKPNIAIKDVENEKMSDSTWSVREICFRAVRNWEIPVQANVYCILVDAFDYRGIYLAPTPRGVCACVFCLIRL